MHIQRDRWVIIREEDEIFCGLAQSYCFKKIANIGDTAIKTYSSEKKAIASFLRSWTMAEELLESGKVKAVNVVEEIATRDFYRRRKGEVDERNND